MTQRRLDYTESQLKTFEVLQRVKMAWVALIFMVILFSIAFVAFLIALFFYEKDTATTILGVIDGILAWTMRQVYRHLFPPRKASS
jgi:hypothetical protein